ncbi:hypothetical protein EJ08DRAFT_737156 [Tothia fuscella]|uniref:Small ribosomal subunit protein mS38 n=1 Tax=Tothia fuscella TaxID=1048955 RepID=A0A9P4TVH3_9PEZI|nr:hypothetical protein EJ08DRAFT_737156 [Tothia fuscella]
MFSSSIGRVVRSTCTTANSTASLTARGPSSTLAAIKAVSQPSHQRRQSSSKTSIPPDGPKRAAPSQQASSSTGRISRRKAKEPAVVPNTRNQPFSKQYPHIPCVPSTAHLRPIDVNLSSFFSLHRPISVTTAIPNEATEKDFDSIFESGSKDPKKVILTLNNVIENLHPHAERDETGRLEWQEINDSEASRYLDGAPQDIPFEKQFSNYPPHRPPPPPSPMTDSITSPAQQKRKASKAKSASTRQKSTTIIVTLTEYTDPSGEKSYAASGTPIIRVPNSQNAVEPTFFTSNKPPMRQPFLERMRIRQQRWQEYREDRTERSPWERREMLLISVKRQRKLKMKKHKYKKLMRKTRNLRRKLGKL